MVDCPKCNAMLKKMPRGKGSKTMRKKWQRKWAGGVKEFVSGDNRPQNVVGLNLPIPDGKKIVERCGSCGWTSEMTYNAQERIWIFSEGVSA